MERRQHVQTIRRGAFLSVFEGRLKVMAVLDQFAPEGAHGRIFLDAVAVRHDEDGPQAAAPRREGDRLPMVAARGGDDAATAGFAFLEIGEIDKPAADLEGADWR